MNKETFVIVMRAVHDALFKLHTPNEKNEVEILNHFINTYISMIAGFHQYLYESLRVFLLSHQDATDEDFEELYDALTIMPERDDQ